MGFPGGTVVKNPPASAGEPSSQAMGNQSQDIQNETPHGYSSSEKKKKKKKKNYIALLLCHCKHCDVFGGKGKLFCVCVN